MLFMIENDARKDLKFRGTWNKFKAEMLKTFNSSELKFKEFVYLLKD